VAEVALAVRIQLSKLQVEMGVAVKLYQALCLLLLEKQSHMLLVLVVLVARRAILRAMVVMAEPLHLLEQQVLAVA
jgi:hypothetical protein